MKRLALRLRLRARFGDQGQALIEVLVAMGIAALMLPALATALVTSREGRALAEKRLQASAMAVEANDAMQSLRERGWSFIASNGTYYPEVDGGSWQLIGGSETVDDFTREIEIQDAYRDSTTGAIVTSGGVLDPSTKRVDVTVSWTAPIASSVVTTSYYQRYLGNEVWQQSSQSDFLAGTTSGTAVVSSGGATYIQSAGTSSDSESGTVVRAFPSNVAAGSLIVAAVSWGGNYAMSCSDSLGNSYTVVTSQHDSTNNQAMGICYAISSSSGANTVTASFPFSLPYRRLLIAEYSGIDSVNPVDVTASNIADGTTAQDNVTSTAATTTAAGDLIFGAVMNDDGAGPTGITAGTGFTQRNSLNNKDLAIQDKVQGAAGAVASTQTFSSNRRYLAQMVAFKVSGGDAHVELATGSGGGGGTPDWSNPTVLSSYNSAGTQDALDVTVAGDYAYFADGSVVTILDVSDKSNPTFVGSYSASGTIRNVQVDGNYMYLSSGNNSAELQIVNITNKASPVQASVVNLPGNNDANSTFVAMSGATNYVYVVREVSTTSGQNEFYIIDVTDPASPSVLGSLNYAAAINSVKVSGNYAFLATDSNTQEVLVVNITLKNSPSLSTAYNAAGSGDALDLALDGNYLYVGTTDNLGTTAELFILNVSTPTSPSLVGQYDAGGSVNGVSTVGGYTFLATSIAAKQLIVLDTTTVSSPTLLANMDLGVVAYDVKTLVGNYAYLATASDTQEFMIVTPTFTGGGGYQPSGTFESSTFDAGANVAYNYLTFIAGTPTDTDIRFQIAVNDDNITWNYVGPTGAGDSYYDNAQAIRLGTTGQYLRFRALLEGPGDATPTLDSVTINYSP